MPVSKKSNLIDLLLKGSKIDKTATCLGYIDLIYH